MLKWHQYISFAFSETFILEISWFFIQLSSLLYMLLHCTTACRVWGATGLCSSLLLSTGPKWRIGQTLSPARSQSVIVRIPPTVSFLFIAWLNKTSLHQLSEKCGQIRAFMCSLSSEDNQELMLTKTNKIKLRL